MGDVIEGPWINRWGAKPGPKYRRGAEDGWAAFKQHREQETGNKVLQDLKDMRARRDGLARKRARLRADGCAR